MKKQLHQINKYSSKKIEIMELYLTNQNNNCKEIAEKMGISFWFVSDTINEFFNNENTITVASKL